MYLTSLATRLATFTSWVDGLGDLSGSHHGYPAGKHKLAQGTFRTLVWPNQAATQLPTG
jgi:hypothetical protein